VKKFILIVFPILKGRIICALKDMWGV